MPSLSTQSLFEDRDTERATLFLADRLGGGGPCAGGDDPDFRAAWRLDHGAVRVLAVKRTMPDVRARLMLAARREQVSFVLARLARFPEVSGLTMVDVVVRDGDEFQLLTDLSMMISTNGEMSFVPAAGDGAGVWWPPAPCGSAGPSWIATNSPTVCAGLPGKTSCPCGSEVTAAPSAVETGEMIL